MVTSEMVTFMETNWLLDARLTDRTMTRMLNARFHSAISRPTVVRYRNELKILYRPPITMQHLTEEQKTVTLNWDRWMLNQHQHAQDLGIQLIIVFTDESRFCRLTDCKWVRFRRGHWNETACRHMRKFPGSFMIWGAIGLNIRSKLVLCERSVNTSEYLSIIQRSGVVEACDSTYGRGRWFMMQDGAPAHQSEATLKALSQVMKILPGWPANRCDLNPIEMLWSIMGARLAELEWTSTGEMFTQLESIWDALDSSMINRLVNDFWRRLVLLVQVNGNSISALLSSHARTAREPQIRPGVFADFTADQDAALRNAVERKGRKWSQLHAIAPELVGRIPYELKQRYMCLDEDHRNSVWVALFEEFGSLAEEGTVVVDSPAQGLD